MEIFIEEIPASGLHLDVKVPGEKWLEKVLAGALPERFSPQDTAELKVSCFKFGKDVDLKGTLDYTMHTECDRCLKAVVHGQHLALKTHLSPLFENRRQALVDDDGEIVKDDEEFSYYEGSSFELDVLVSELLLLNQPMKLLCSEACKGLCQRCGKDLNEGPCECRAQQPNIRWAALKDLKIKEKN